MMPSTTTTTGVALPPLLDLLAAPTPGTPAGKGSGAFDALLQPPPTRLVTDEMAGKSVEKEPRPRQENSPNSLRQAPIHPPDDESSRGQAEGDSIDAPDLPPAEKPANETSSDDPEPDSGPSVVAESWAGLSACMATAPAEPGEAENELANASEPAPAVIQGGKQSPSALAAQQEPPISLAGREGETEPAAAASDAESAELPVNPIIAAEQGAGRDSRLANVVQPVNADGHENFAGEARHDSRAAAAVLEAQPASSDQPGEQREEKSFSQELALATADSQSAEPAPPMNFQPVATDVPPAAAVAPALQTVPAVRPPSSTSASSASSAGSAAIDPQGSARRARLPGELVVRDAGRAARHSATNIDTTRLLSRVARAFAAAQQRDGEIQLRLSPPELGSLKLTVQMQDGGLAARLETETPEAKSAILDNLPALRERLAEQGLRIERFDVDLMQRQPGGMPDRPSDQERNAPPAPRSEPIARPRAEPSLPPRSIVAASSSHSGLNVIV